MSGALYVQVLKLEKRVAELESKIEALRAVPEAVPAPEPKKVKLTLPEKPDANGRKRAPEPA